MNGKNGNRPKHVHRDALGPARATPAASHFSVVPRPTGRPQAKFRFWPHFWKSLIAIVAGNAVYFLLLSPHLPPRGQHVPGRVDVGLLVDFWVCLACFGVLELLVNARNRRLRQL
jgi:hypothetical protein